MYLQIYKVTKKLLKTLMQKFKGKINTNFGKLK